jgi:hypothetical protein
LVKSDTGEFEELGGRWRMPAFFAPGERDVAAERGGGEGRHRDLGSGPVRV